MAARLRLGFVAAVGKWAGVCVRVGRRSDIGAWFRLVAPPGPMAFVKTFVQVRMLSEHQGIVVGDRGYATE